MNIFQGLHEEKEHLKQFTVLLGWYDNQSGMRVQRNARPCKN